MDTPRLLLDVRNVVGESAVWDDRRQCLWWVDIGGKRIHRLAPDGGEHVSFATPDRPTSIGLTADDRLIVGLMKQVALWTPGGDFETLAEIEPDLADNRLNEGQVAPDGSYWVGTMQNNLTVEGEPKPIAGRHGQLWRVAPNGDLRLAVPERFGITNTMLWLDAAALSQRTRWTTRCFPTREAMRNCGSGRHSARRFRAACRTVPASMPRASSGTVASPVAAASSVSHPMDGSTASSICPARRPRVAPLAAQT